MAPCRKIRFIRDKYLYVGDITISTIKDFNAKNDKDKFEKLVIDRSKAKSSSTFTGASYPASNNPSATGNDGGSTWEIDLGKTYDWISINATTNANKIQILAENDALSYERSVVKQRNDTVDTRIQPKQWPTEIVNYWSDDLIHPIKKIDCINDKYWTGNIQKCETSNIDQWGDNIGCKGYTLVRRKFDDLGRPNKILGPEQPYQSLVDNKTLDEGLYRIVDGTACNISLPNNPNVKVGDKTRDGCMEIYNTCTGTGCGKRADGSLFYAQPVIGCRDGYLSDWSPWACTNGIAKKTRQCFEPLNGGKPCPPGPLEGTSTCSDAMVTDWSYWSNCDGSTTKRTRVCLTPPTNGGAPCPNLEEVKNCSDGKLSDWSPWTCDIKTNTLSRNRTCIPPINSGQPCPVGNLQEERDCFTRDGVLSNWSPWTCTNGNAKRTRICIQPTKYGKPCPPGPLEETSTCSDGKLTDWIEEECNNSIKKRSRSCIPPTNGGAPCQQGPLEETISCTRNFNNVWDNVKVQNDIKKTTDTLFNGVKDVIEGVVKAFDIVIPGQKPCSDWDSRYRDDKTSCWLDTYGRGAGRGKDYGPCPPRSSEKPGILTRDCYGDQTDRKDGRNEGETLWSHADNKPGGKDGCSWDRHVEGVLCFRDCPDGYFGRATDKCWASGANEYGVMKYGVDRLKCNDDEDGWGAFCYPKCASGYHAVGCCTCEPDGGPAVKKTAMDRYLCPPPGNTTHTKLVGAFCYRS